MLGEKRGSRPVNVPSVIRYAVTPALSRRELKRNRTNVCRSAQRTDNQRGELPVLSVTAWPLGGAPSFSQVRSSLSQP